MLRHVVRAPRLLAASLALLAVVALASLTSAQLQPHPATPLDGTVTISGTVVTDAGSPAAGVIVKLLMNSPTAAAPKPHGPGENPTGESGFTPDATPLQKGGGGGGGERIIKTVKTDSAGAFSFPDVQPNKYIVAASVGQMKARQELEVKAGQAPPALKLQLRKA